MNITETEITYTYWIKDVESLAIRTGAKATFVPDRVRIVIDGTKNQPRWAKLFGPRLLASGNVSKVVHERVMWDESAWPDWLHDLVETTIKRLKNDA